MSIIQPESDIYLLTNVPLNSHYNHTVLYDNVDTQYADFFSHRAFTFTEQSYQRWKRGYLRVAAKCDDLYGVNYLMFRNSGFGNKWFYAFVDTPKYINNNCSEIHYTIDVIQTWMFDYDIPPCFVEREHSATDEIGDNLVAEDIDCGELEVTNTFPLRFEYFLGGIITSKPPASTFTPTIAGVGTVGYKVKIQFGPDSWGIWNNTPDGPAGVPSGLYMMYGFPISDNDINNYWNTHSSMYDMQDYIPVGGSLNGAYLTLGKMVEFICDGNIPSATIGSVPNPFGLMSIDDIVSVFIYPADINRLSNQANALGLGYRSPIGANNVQLNNRPQYFTDINSGTPFFPKNNKLFTYPYVRLKVSNNMGQTLDLKYEEMPGYNATYFTPTATWIGNIVGNPNVTIVFPYNGQLTNFDFSLSIGDFPTPAYKGSQFSQWLQNNKFSWLVGTVSSAISLKNGIGAMEAKDTMIPIYSKTETRTETISDKGEGSRVTFSEREGERLQHSEGKAFPLQYATNMLSRIAQPLDIMNAPNTIGSTITNDVLNVGTNRVGFNFYAMAIRKQYAERIDEYFTMYGYATKKVKRLNIRGAKRRRNFNYVKTAGCLVKPTNIKGLATEDIVQIENIYNKGITFWSNMSNVGDYTLTNDIITV